MLTLVVANPLLRVIVKVSVPSVVWSADTLTVSTPPLLRLPVKLALLISADVTPVIV